MITPFTLAQIDRGIEWAIKDELIRKNLHPDVRAFNIANDPAGLDAARNAMISAGTYVELFGVGGFNNRGDLKQKTIIIDRVKVNAGSIGFGRPVDFTQVGSGQSMTFNKVTTAETTNDIEYEFRIITLKTRDDRALTQVMGQAFNRRRFLKGINDDLTNTEGGFWIFQNFEPVDVSDGNNIERIYRYIVRHVVFDEDRIVQQDIQPIQSIQVNVNGFGEPDNTDDDIVVNLN